MTLQVSGLNRDLAVVGSMAFVKAIMREGFPVGVNLVGDGSINPVRLRAADEFGAMPFDLFRFFFEIARRRLSASDAL